MQGVIKTWGMVYFRSQFTGGNMERPVTTLFMLMSVDGKISTGAADELDMDRDLPLIDGVKEGLHQYYEIEQTTDLWSFNTGRVQEKMGVNEKEMPAKTPVSFVILDNRHLTEHGVRYFCARSKQAVVITSNPSHPAFQVSESNLHIIYQETQSLKEALARLKRECGCERLTVQSGGKDTSTLNDGTSLTAKKELSGLGALKLEECSVLEDSYIRLRYKVIS